MKIDFDKFNLSQKIYSVVGAVAGILVYMNDKDNLNVAIGTVLLTAVVVFLLRYKAAKVLINIAVIICLLWLASLAAEPYLQQVSQRLANEVQTGQFDANKYLANMIIKIFSTPFFWVAVLAAILTMVIGVKKGILKNWW